jgi:hypothetical protein
MKRIVLAFATMAMLSAGGFRNSGRRIDGGC